MTLTTAREANYFFCCRSGMKVLPTTEPIQVSGHHSMEACHFPLSGPQEGHFRFVWNFWLSSSLQLITWRGHFCIVRPSSGTSEIWTINLQCKVRTSGSRQSPPHLLTLALDSTSIFHFAVGDADTAILLLSL